MLPAPPPPGFRFYAALRHSVSCFGATPLVHPYSWINPHALFMVWTPPPRAPAATLLGPQFMRYNLYALLISRINIACSFPTPSGSSERRTSARMLLFAARGVTNPGTLLRLLRADNINAACIARHSFAERSDTFDASLSTPLHYVPHLLWLGHKPLLVPRARTTAFISCWFDARYSLPYLSFVLPLY